MSPGKRLIPMEAITAKTFFLPHEGYLLVEIVEAEARTKSGLAIPDEVKSQNEPMSGRVLEMGKPTVLGGTFYGVPSFVIDSNEEGLGGRHYKLKKGDKIIFKRHTQQEITNFGEEKKIAFVHFDSVLGVELPREENNGDNS